MNYILDFCLLENLHIKRNIEILKIDSHKMILC